MTSVELPPAIQRWNRQQKRNKLKKPSRLLSIAKLFGEFVVRRLRA